MAVLLIPVRVLCGHCRCKLGMLHGEPLRRSRQWGAGDPELRQDSGYRYRCARCGGDYPARLDKLAQAYRRAARRTEARHRVIFLPGDLR
jgi:hypothetical protein